MRVNGIGGAVLYANDPKALAEWYTRHFGIEFQGDAEAQYYYAEFRSRDFDDPAKKLSTVLAILPSPKQLGNRRGSFMLNLRVDHIEALVAQLAADGIGTEAIETDSDGAARGKFTRLRDLEGNRIELYQPLR